MNDDLTPVEEQALDAMLIEMLGNAGPPDLSREIMAQYQQTYQDGAPVVQPEDRSTKRVSETRLTATQKQFTALIAVVATLAAMFLMAMWLRSDYQPAQSSPTLAGNETAASNRPLTVPDSRGPQVDVSSDELVSKIPDAAPPRSPARGIPMDLAVVGDDPLETIQDPQVGPAEQPQNLESVVLVSQQVESELRGYWDAIGIEPTNDATGEEIVARLAVLLDVDLPVDSMDDPDQLQLELAEQSVSRAIAARWLQQISERGVYRVDQELRNGLIEDLAACFSSGQEFDQMLAAWIAGRSPNSAAFFAAVSSGSRRAGDNFAMARRLAALTMNVDLRCTRCHDSYIEGNGLQNDFWAFDAFLGRGVTRDRDGHVSIDTAPATGKSFFYALPDGRQRVVEPSVATAWMNDQTEQPIVTVREWSEKLIGSPELARGVVNSLWQLVHGQPLHGRVVDPISAPHNDSLDRLEDKLVQDLVRSQFNVARTLALIIASPVTQRSVPASLLPENALVASESETAAAKSAVNAFAAALPPRNQLGMNDRYAQVMRATGATLSTDDSPIVAQIDTATDNPRNRKPDANALATDFPGPAKSHPVQWLSLIEDENSQVEHLGYLAGMSQVPDSVLQIAEKMRKTGDTSTALHRVWWMIRP